MALTNFLLMYCTAKYASTNSSSALLLQKRQLPTWLDLVHPKVHTKVPLLTPAKFTVQLPMWYAIVHLRRHGSRVLYIGF